MVLSRSRVQMSMVHLGMHHLLDFIRREKGRVVSSPWLAMGVGRKVLQTQES